MAALLPGAQHREDRNNGDVNGLKASSPALRGGKRALTPQAASGFNAGASTRLTAPNEFATHPAPN